MNELAQPAFRPAAFCGPGCAVPNEQNSKVILNDRFKLDKKMKILAIALLTAMAPVAASADENWTGFYSGAQLGFADVSDGANDSGDATFGVHGGYLHDFGSYVLGGELSYDAGAKIDAGGGVEKVDTIRAKIKGGHEFGRTLIYGVAGFSKMDTNAGSVDGTFYGLGASYRMSDKVILGAEYLHDTFDTVGADTKADTLSLRASYQF